MIVWTTGTASGGDDDSGLGGTPAQVGDRLLITGLFQLLIGSFIRINKDFIVIVIVIIVITLRIEGEFTGHKI